MWRVVNSIIVHVVEQFFVSCRMRSKQASVLIMGNDESALLYQTTCYSICSAYLVRYRIERFGKSPVHAHVPHVLYTTTPLLFEHFVLRHEQRIDTHMVHAWCYCM